MADDKPTVLDVAAFILSQMGSMPTLKLQKLVYYAQVWSLVWDKEPLFDDRIVAWENGPVAPRLYEVHKSDFKIHAIPDGDDSKLSSGQRDTIKEVLEAYGDKTSRWLLDLTHAEAPWINARKGLFPGQEGQNEITHAAIIAYYSCLT